MYRMDKVAHCAFNALAILALLTPVASVSGGCFGCWACTMVGCEDGFTLKIMNPDGSPVLNYMVKATIDGVTRSSSCGPMFEPNPDAGVEDALDAGEALPHLGSCFPDGLSLIAQTRPTPMLDVEITVIDDKTSTWTETIFLVYKDFYPNGEDCDPVCFGALAVVVRKS